MSGIFKRGDDADDGQTAERVGVVEAVFALFQRFVSSSLGMPEIEPADFRAAALLMDGPWPLRAGDALHLAISRHAGATLVTYDKLLTASARALGAKVRDPLARTIK